MNNNFSSEDSDHEPDFGDDINLQRTYLKHMHDKCVKYEKDIQNLAKERKDRNTALQEIQRQIEELQMEIQYKDLKINKMQNVYDELNEKDKNQQDTDAAEHKETTSRVEKVLPNCFLRYINRLMFSKKAEFEGRIERKKNVAQAVCVKYYKDDPTNEDFGQFVVQTYSLQVFGLSNDLKFSDLLNLCTDHWKIKNKEDYVLTDQDHHDLTLLYKVPIVQYLPQENNGAALFILRPKNRRMKELISTQKAGIMLVPESEKQGKLQEELKKVFSLIRKVKPGVKTYEASQEESDNNDSPVDGTIFNFLILVSIMALMLTALVKSAIQPDDENALIKFDAAFTAPTYFSSSSEFSKALPSLIYDYNETANRPISLHYIPIGKKRIITNKMIETRCTQTTHRLFCIYNDYYTAENLDKSPMNNTLPEASEYREVSAGEEINIKGRSMMFDGSGFIYDAPLGMNYKEANDIISNKLKTKDRGTFFSDSVRSTIIHTAYFEPNRHLIFERTLLFEFTSSNVVEITDRKTYFKPHSDDDPNDIYRHKIDLALLIVTVVGYSLNVIWNISKKRKAIELIQPRNLLKYGIIGLVVGYFFNINDSPEMSIQEIITSDQFMSFYKYGESRQSAMIFLTVAFFGHSLTMIRSLVFSSTINVFLNIFAQSYKDFLAFLLIFFSSFLGFSFIFWIAFGPYINNLQQLTSTAFEIFQYFATVTQLFIINEFWAVILVIVMCFIIFIQLDALMMSLIQENVRRLYVKPKANGPQKLPFREALDKIMLKVNGLQNKVKGIFGEFGRKKVSSK